MIFQPTLPRLSYTSPRLYHSFPSLERRSTGKGKEKAKYVLAKYGQKCKKKITFQKKIVIVKYMGEQAPSSFTLKEDIIQLRGMLPEMDYGSSETKVRTIISATLQSGLKKSIGLFDFEFLEAAGKQLCVPAHTSELEWTGRAVKELAGSGSIYVRIITDEESNESDCDSSCATSCDSPEVKIETPGTYYINV